MKRPLSKDAAARRWLGPAVLIIAIALLTLVTVLIAVREASALVGEVEASSERIADKVGDGTPAPALPSAHRTPRATTPASTNCIVSWSRTYRALNELSADSDSVVRATAIRQETVALRPGFGPEPTREALRTVFRVTEALGGKTPAVEIAVLEDVCPNLTVRVGEEWVLFLKASDISTEPRTTDNYFTGGPQGQFRIVAARVSGPFHDFAPLVHSYEGAMFSELLDDVARIATR